MEPLKNIYNKKSISLMAKSIKREHPTFNHAAFIKKAMNRIEYLEMKARVVQISQILNEELPKNFKEAVSILLLTLKSEKNPEGLEGFILWPYTQFIEAYGLNHYSVSMKVLYEITKRFTSEFGVRPFFENHPERTYPLFHKQCADKNEHVRRWVSEGTRPNLPWGKNISHLKHNLSKNIELLEKLKNDPSEYVRKSVANHMNDITWIDENLALKTLKKWSKDKSPETQKLVRQALRNLVKKGNPKALSLLGYKADTKVTVDQIELSKKVIKEGDSFDLSFTVKNLEKSKASLMVDYKIHYPKKDRKISVKTFKLKTLTLGTGESALVSKKISFKKVSTRTHYSGEHKIEVQINGDIKAQSTFKLLCASV